MSVCSITCGDGVTDYKLEACDDGNLESRDGCDQYCEIEPGFECYPTPAINIDVKSECTWVSTCGDGKL